MKLRTFLITGGLVLLSTWIARADEQTPAAPDKPPVAQAEKSSDKPKDDKSLPWLDNLEAAQAEARTLNRPLLVRVGGPGCPWCVKLDEEIRKEEVQRELGRWARVYIDIEQSESEAIGLGIGPIPALRLLTPAGKIVANHDGFIPSEELVAWLGKHFDEAAASIPDVLTAVGPPDAGAVDKLIAEFAQPDPVRRESAIRRMLPYPNISAKAVAIAFAEGRLSTRLATLDLLASWKAPVAGLDPWRPESITEERRKKLADWAQATNPPSAEDKQELSLVQLVMAREDIAKLLDAKPGEVPGIRERIARLGKLALPLVYDELKNVTNDRARERLLALRYRLVASDALVLTWPGGLEQLASIDARARHQAAEQFLARATAADQPLLLELFSDSDPLVREMSLRGLRRIGGASTSSALVKLLDDPEPNVRAAVLKQLAEKPSADLVPTIAAYVKKEKDSDLLVHAIRCLKNTTDQRAVASLQTLLKHESWQVRAEATEVLGSLASNDHDPSQQEKRSTIYVALIEALDDEDGFVVSRAMTGLQSVDLEIVVEPLAKAALRHPDLASKILSQIVTGQQTRKKGLEHLRRFAIHKDPRLRAAAVQGLASAIPQEIEKEVLAGLSDAESLVRITAARALLTYFDSNRQIPAAQNEILLDQSTVKWVQPISPGTIPPPRQERTGVLDVLTFLFGGGVAPPPPAPATFPPTAPAAPPAAVPAPAPAAPPAPASVPATVPAPPPAPAVTPVPPPSSPRAAIPNVEAEKKEADKTDPMEDWLIGYRAGHTRSPWLEKTAEPLRKMLSATDAEERLVAAVALVPLARDSEALPVLRQAVKERPREMETASKALSWLPWPARLELLHYLLDLKPNHAQARQIINAFVVIKTKPAREILWKLLEGAPPIELVATIQAELGEIFQTGNYLYNQQAKRTKGTEEHIVELKLYAVGAPWQRVVALSLLLALGEDEVLLLAPKTLDDRVIPADVRRDVLQILFVALPDEQARNAAVPYVASPDAPVRKLAVKFLSTGGQPQPTLRGSIYLQSRSRVNRTVSNERTVQKTPSALKPEMLHPLLSDSDPELVAGAAYLLATLKDERGLQKLIETWRAPAVRDRLLTNLLYGAVAAMDKPEHVPLLEEIYGKLTREEMADFYWTIRSMHGVEVLKLRKRIRHEIGMENLDPNRAVIQERGTAEYKLTFEGTFQE